MNMKTIQKAAFALLLGMMSTTGFAQAKLHLSSGLELTHLWRGLEVSKGLTFDNDISISDKNDHFRVDFWGGMQVSGDYKEFDYYASYNYGGFSAAVWDIFNFSDGIYDDTRGTEKPYRIFNYDCHTTGHFLDAVISYNFGQKVPLTLSWSTIFAGRDRGAKNEQNLYSTFVQASYKVYEDNNFIVTPSVGGVFAMNPEEGTKATFYSKTAGVNDVRMNVTYKLKVGKHSMPVTATAMWNPEANRGYFGASINLLNL